MEKCVQKIYESFLFDSTTTLEENKNLSAPAGNCYGLCLKTVDKIESEVADICVNVVQSTLTPYGSNIPGKHVAGIVILQENDTGKTTYILFDAGVNKHKTFAIHVTDDESNVSEEFGKDFDKKEKRLGYYKVTHDVQKQAFVIEKKAKEDGVFVEYAVLYKRIVEDEFLQELFRQSESATTHKINVRASTGVALNGIATKKETEWVITSFANSKQTIKRTVNLDDENVMEFVTLGLESHQVFYFYAWIEKIKKLH